MGKRGVKPKPAAIKAKRGERAPKAKVIALPGARFIPDEQLKQLALEDDAPQELNPIAKKEWVRLAPLLKKMKLLDATNRTLFMAYCHAWSDWLSAKNTLDDHFAEGGSRLYDLPMGSQKTHPLITDEREAYKRFSRAASEFGLSPATRGDVTQHDHAGAGGKESLV